MIITLTIGKWSSHLIFFYLLYFGTAIWKSISSYYSTLSFFIVKNNKCFFFLNIFELLELKEVLGKKSVQHMIMNNQVLRGMPSEAQEKVNNLSPNIRSTVSYSELSLNIVSVNIKMDIFVINRYYSVHLLHMIWWGVLSSE